MQSMVEGARQTILDPRLLALAPQMRRHLFVDALEHVAHRRLAAGMQRAVASASFCAEITVSRISASACLWRSSDQTPRRMRWFFSLITGSPSGQASDSVFGR